MTGGQRSALLYNAASAKAACLATRIVALRVNISGRSDEDRDSFRLSDRDGVQLELVSFLLRLVKCLSASFVSFQCQGCSLHC